LGSGFEGRFDRAGTIEVALLHGELAGVSDLQLLNGANLAAVLAQNGEWEVLQFGEAEETAPSVWRLGRLLRGQYGTRPAMLAGAAEATWFVLLDEAVSAAGLKAGEIGLALNWRIGPIGYDFAGPTFAAITTAGGVRARRPLSPVHLSATPLGDGGIRFDWIRRGRIDADRGLAGAVPLGEEAEAYAVEVAPEGGSAVRLATAAQPQWIYAAADIAADFAGAPATVAVTVRQLGGGVQGDPSTITLDIN
jgi:hypothetical protein